MKKIVLIGPESTGKTTLSKFLSENYNEPWVPEYARTYLEKTNGKYNQSDLLLIAKGQINNEEILEKSSSQFLFCDTDLLVIKIWSEHLYANCDQWILKQIESRKYDHYFLCKNDFPWKADPLRENPELGDYFYDQFKKLLNDLNKSYTELSGNLEERVNTAKRILADLK